MARSTTMTRPGGTYLGDLLRNEWHPGYCCVSAKLVNPLAGALTNFNPIGQPVKASGANFVFVQDGDEANAIGLVLHDKPISVPGSGTDGGVSAEKYMILRRGPALIAEDAIAAGATVAGDDVNGDALTIATIVTALAALSPPIIAQVDLTPTEEHTT